MLLFEFEAKSVFAENGIPVPDARLVSDVTQLEDAVRQLGDSVVIKAQVLSGGRSKAGLVIKVDGLRAAKLAFTGMLGARAGEEIVKRVLVERQVPHDREIYLAITIDSNASQPLLLMSCQGGIDIEEIADADPGSVGRLLIDPVIGPQAYQVRQLAGEAGIEPGLAIKLGVFTQGLWRSFVRSQLILAEINPIAVTHEGALVALDAKAEIDGYVATRQDCFDIDSHLTGETKTEQRARKAGLSYLEMSGNIGIAGNGAGLMMLIVDMLSRRGLNPANFCDAGGAVARPGSGGGAIDWWAGVIAIVLSNAKVEALFFNLHGGNHRGDEVATGLLKGLKQAGRRVPTVVRISGTREAEGREILAAAGITSHASLSEAIDALAAILEPGR